MRRESEKGPAIGCGTGPRVWLIRSCLEGVLLRWNIMGHRVEHILLKWYIVGRWSISILEDAFYVYIPLTQYKVQFCITNNTISTLMDNTVQS